MPRMANGDDVLPLSRWRATLARARGRGLADALLEDPSAKRWVPSLPPQELYYAIQEVGLADAGELLALASDEQLRAFIDLAVWERDQVRLDRAGEWIDALVDLGPERLAAAVEALDPELVALFIQKQARVYDLTLEAPPEEPEGHFYPTPDRFFLLDVLSTGEEAKRLERMLDWLYRADIEIGRKVVMSAKWELATDLEEWAYRWRSGRMADLGFVDFYDALEVYRWLDPATVKIGEGSAEAHAPSETPVLPVALAPAAGDGFLARALATIGDAEALGRVHQGLLVLANRVMAADRVEPGDPEGAKQALARVAAYLGLGLAYLGRGDAEAAGAALRTVAAVRIFRVGVSLTLKLGRAAETLVERAFVTLVPRQASLLDEPLRSEVAALRERRPMRLVGGKRALFTTLAEVGEAAALLEEAALVGETVRRGLGVDPARLAAEALAGVSPARELITFSTVVATLMANALLERPPALVPLAPADLRPLRETALLDGKLRADRRTELRALMTARLHERAFDLPRPWERWLDQWFAHLEATLAPSTVGAPAADPRDVRGLLIKVERRIP